MTWASDNETLTHSSLAKLEAFYRANHEEFSDKDFQLMFGMNGPRRRGDVGRYHMLKKKMNIS